MKIALFAVLVFLIILHPVSAQLSDRTGLTQRFTIETGGYDFNSLPQDQKNQMIQRVQDYMKSKEFTAETFEMFSLQGTPSSILVDRKGILRDVSFGQNGNLEPVIQSLINE